MGRPIPPREGAEEWRLRNQEDDDDDEEDEQQCSDEGAPWQEDSDASGEERWADPSGGVLTRLLHAAGDGDADRLGECLEELNVSVDERGPDGDSALHLASVYGHSDCVRALLAAGARADLCDEDSATPLHDAAAGGYLNVVQLLHEAAPQALHAVDDDGDTPLHNAARGGHLEVACYLLQHGADATAVNAGFERPLDLAERASPLRALLQQACNRAAVDPV